jgi:hypothetical protein
MGNVMNNKRLAILLLLGLLSYGRASAAEYTVTNIIDDNSSDPPPTGSLRAAIKAMNDGGGGTIEFNLLPSSTISLQSGLLIFNPLTFTVASGSNFTVSASNIDSPLFTIADDQQVIIPAGLSLVNTYDGVDNTGHEVLKSSGELQLGALQGNIEVHLTNGGDFSAFAISANSITVNGDLSGRVSATSDTNGMALQATNSITISGNLSGTVEVEAAGSAKGINGSSVTIDKALTGRIIATATSSTGRDSYGIQSNSGNLTITEGIHETGSIVVRASDSANTGNIFYGISSNGTLTIGQASGTSYGISGTVRASGGANAKGISSGDAISVYGGIAGEVTAEAKSGNNSSAIQGNRDISIGGGIAGNLTASSVNGSSSAALFSSNNTSIEGGISGSLTATAGTSGAYGVRTRQGTISITGALSGQIEASAGTTDAYGLYTMTSNGDISIDGITPTGLISAKAGTGTAYGIQSRSWNVTVNGAIDGGIEASATSGGTVYGISTAKSLTIRDGIGSTGRVTATGGGTKVAALFAENGGIHGATVDDAVIIDGLVSASGNGAVAGIMSNGAMNLLVEGVGEVSGIDTGASGLGYSIFSGNFNPAGDGFISTLASADRVVVQGSGKLTGNVFLGAGIDIMSVTGQSMVSGSVDLGIGNDRLSLADGGVVTGTILGGDGTDTLAYDAQSVPMTVADVHSGFEIIVKEGPESLTLGGTNPISSLDAQSMEINGGSFINEGRVTMSDRIDMAAETVLDNRATGSISIASGTGTLTGNDGVQTIVNRGLFSCNIALSGGSDRLEIRDGAMLTSAVLDGGDGSDTLLFSNWIGRVEWSLENWETIEVRDGATLHLGSSRSILPSAGLPLAMTIEAGSTVLATGSSPGIYTLGGEMVNNGLLELRDGSADDRVTLTGTLSGTGKVGLDVAMSKEQNRTNDPEHLDLLVAESFTGSMPVLVRNISRGGIIMKTEGKGILVGDATAAGSSAAFSLDPSNDFREALVSLRQGGADGIGDDWYLVVTRGAPPVEHRVMRTVGPLISDLGLESLPRFEEKQAYGWGGFGGEREPCSWWSRATGRKIEGNYESEDVSVQAKGYMGTVQTGVDLLGSCRGGTMFRAGLYVDTGTLRSDIRRDNGQMAGRVGVTSLGGGGYASVERSGDWYLEGTVQANSYSLEAEFTGGAKQSGKTMGYLGSVEFGRRIGVTDVLSIEPQAQVIWQHVGSWETETGGEVGRAKVMSLSMAICRAGMTGKLDMAHWAVRPVFDVQVQRRFGALGQVLYPDVDISYPVEADRMKLAGSIGLGSRNRSPKSIEYSLKAGMATGIGGPGSSEWMLSLNFRKSW